MSKVLSKSVSFIDEEDGFVVYEAGTKDSDMPERHVERISNPKAWDELQRAIPDDDYVLIPEGMTKEQFIAAAKATADTTGEGHPKAEEEAEDDLEGLKKDELIEVAEEEGVDLTGASTKADIIDRIRAVRDAGNA